MCTTLVWAGEDCKKLFKMLSNFVFAAIEPIETLVSRTVEKEVKVGAEVAAELSDERVPVALLVCATPVLAEEHLQSSEFI
jgi:hypothetical protein